MKKVLYYHLYCTENMLSWTNAVYEQIGLIQSSGLMKELDRIEISALVYNDRQSDQLNYILETYPVNVKLENVINPFKSDFEMISNLYTHMGVHEDYTHHKIYNDALNSKEDYAICYMQSKGVIQYLKNNILELKKYYHWRNYLNWGNIQKWKVCNDALENGYDVAGVDFQEKPVPHFRGTMFWTKASHVRELSDPKTDLWWNELKEKSNDNWIKNCAPRFKAEFWVTSKPNTKVFNHHVPEENPASVPYIKYSQQ